MALTRIARARLRTSAIHTGDKARFLTGYAQIGRALVLPVERRGRRCAKVPQRRVPEALMEAKIRVTLLTPLATNALGAGTASERAMTGRNLVTCGASARAQATPIVQQKRAVMMHLCAARMAAARSGAANTSQKQKRRHRYRVVLLLL